LELLEKITNIINTNNYTTIKEMGKVMMELKKLGVSYDGKLASDIIKSQLQPNDVKKIG
jgi:uncharacterized protein YqeY